MSALATESHELGGLGISYSEFTNMSPWNFEFLLMFKKEHRERAKQRRDELREQHKGR